MAAKSRRRRASGGLAALKRALWAVIVYNLEVIEEAELEHDLRQRACNSLTQAALAYSRVVEQHDMAQQMAALQHLASGNGHQR
jgi:hypothetical protein